MFVVAFYFTRVLLTVILWRCTPMIPDDAVIDDCLQLGILAIGYIVAFGMAYLQYRVGIRYADNGDDEENDKR